MRGKAALQPRLGPDDLLIVTADHGEALGEHGHPYHSTDLYNAQIRVPLPDTFHGLTDVEVRYRRRYLDLLMNEESRDTALVRARTVSAIRRISHRSAST